MIINLQNIGLKCSDTVQSTDSNIKAEFLNQSVNQPAAPMDYRQKARIFSLAVTVLFLGYVLFYLFYKKDPKFSNFSFIAFSGIMFGVDNSIISRFYLCFLNSLLLIPIAYNLFYNVDSPSFYYPLLSLYLFTLVCFTISSINIKTVLFLTLSPVLMFLMVFLCQKYYFTDVALI